MKVYEESELGKFEDFLSERTCVIKFGAEWCGPCKAVKPALEKAEEETGVEFFDVDIDVYGEQAGAYNVRSIPTVVAFKNGEPVDVLVGALDKESYVKLASKVL